MKLSDWCEKHNVGPSDLGRSINVARQAAARYILGQRVPTPEKIVEIRDLTKGKVGADDLVDANIEYRKVVSARSRPKANRRQR